MGKQAEDYYDIPFDLLPSANFAGRPMSDISMLDGLWTKMTSSSPSSSETEEDEGPSAALWHDLAQASHSLPIRSIQRPKSRTSIPTREDPKPQLVNSSNDAETTGNPQPQRKADTAPSDTDFPLDAAMLQSTRAASARIGETNIQERGNPQVAHRFNGPDTVNWTVERDPNNGKSVPLQNSAQIVPGHKAARVPCSFSQKLRIQRTLEQKQMGKLKTSLANHNVRKSPTSANSMLATPRELYVIPEKQVAHDGTPPWPRVVHDTQSEMNSFMSWKRKSTESTSSKTTSSAVQPVVQAHTYFDGATDVKTEHLPPRIYVPGPICLKKHAVSPRRDLEARLDPFDGIQTNAHELSEVMVEEATVVFFEALGVMENATEACLDRYWLQIGRGYSQGYAQGDSGWRTTSISSVTDAASPPSPHMAHSLYGSRFSFSSASSSGSSSPVKMKSARTVWSRLLALSNPETALSKTPGILGRQGRK